MRNKLRERFGLKADQEGAFLFVAAATRHCCDIRNVADDVLAYFLPAGGPSAVAVATEIDTYGQLAIDHLTRLIASPANPLAHARSGFGVEIIYTRNGRKRIVHA